MKQEIHAALVSAYSSLLEGNKGVYAAVPITSGIRLWTLAKDLGVSDLFRVQEYAPERYKNEVLEPNCLDAAEFVRSARILHPLIIDPSRVVVQGWSQSDYKNFWEDILLHFIKAVLVSPKWMFSRGCVYECIFAIRHSIPILDSNGKSVSVEEMRLLTLEAMDMRQSLGIYAEFLDEFMEATRKVPTNR